MWIHAVDEKVRMHEQRAEVLKLAGELRRAQRRARDESRNRAIRAQLEDAEDGRSDPVVTIDTVDLTGDAPVDITGVTPAGPFTTPRSAPIQRLPATQSILSPRTKRTRSRSASRGGKRRRSNTPLEDRAINALAQPTAVDERSNLPTEPTSKRPDTCGCPQSIASVKERLATLEQRFLMREEIINRQMNYLVEFQQRQMATNQLLLEGGNDTMSEVEDEGDSW
jgi:hypothetical protein